jgi:hypothetical protein
VPVDVERHRVQSFFSCSRRPLRGRPAIGRHARGPPPAPTRPAGGCTGAAAQDEENVLAGRAGLRDSRGERGGCVRVRPNGISPTSRRAITPRQGGSRAAQRRSSGRVPLTQRDRAAPGRRDAERPPTKLKSSLSQSVEELVVFQ